jgi:serine/threonine-protein kinase
MACANRYFMNQKCLTLRKYGEYHLIKQLANRSNIELWLACRYINKKFQNFCAVKRVEVKESFDNSMGEKLLQEGRTNFMLRHPNIVTCTDYGSPEPGGGGSVYFVMDYVFGKNLSQIQRSQIKNMEQDVDLSFVLQVICSLARALDYIHRFQNPYTLEFTPIIHRDISPANIMISYSGEIKVLDFGIAIQQGDDALSNKPAGKITYMSPEQIAGQQLSVGSDLFSLGIIFWELLCGKKMFDKNDAWKKRSKESNFKIVHPCNVNASVPEDLGIICMKCLCPKPEDRYQRVSDFLNALQKGSVNYQNHGQLGVQDYMTRLFAEELKKERIFLEKITEASSPCDFSFYDSTDVDGSCLPGSEDRQQIKHYDEYTMTPTESLVEQRVETNDAVFVQTEATITCTD